METTKSILAFLFLLLSHWDWQYSLGLGYGRQTRLGTFFRIVMIGFAAYLIWKNFMSPRPADSEWLVMNLLQSVLVLAGLVIHAGYLRGDYLCRMRVYDKLKSIK
ncbi:MAG: hypothetical protein R3D58_13295 [Saprospiraceae bacterium]